MAVVIPAALHDRTHHPKFEIVLTLACAHRWLYPRLLNQTRRAMAAAGPLGRLRGMIMMLVGPGVLP